MSDFLRFSPDILRRLGEELVPNIDQGLIELVKNAYDADATFCNISLDKLMSGNGAIRISDDGSGMSGEEIRKGWLVIGRSNKKKDSLTKVYKRVPVGDKGLGRLAALRLGAKVTLHTRPKTTPGKQFSLVLNWSKYEAADVVEDVALEIVEEATEKKHGTDIIIEGITAKITRTTVNKLARSLLLLSDPFAKFEEQLSLTSEKSNRHKRVLDPGFSATLLTEDFKDLQAKVGHSYFSDAEYRIQCEVSNHGNAVFKLLDWKGDVLHEKIDDDTYHAPPLTFDLWTYLLKKDSFSTRSSTLTEVRNWLGELGGVHFYEDGIRVPPYGGADYDLLELNLRRARSPEVRPSTNTSVGRIRVSNIDGKLIQKTDRIGYVENFAFTEIKRVCGEALDWAARVLLKERDSKRVAERKSKKEKAEKATKKLEKVLGKSVSPIERKKVDDAIAHFVKETEKEAKSLRDDLQLYRSLATAGMTSAVFAHEIGSPLKRIDGALKYLIRLIPETEKSKVDSRVKRVATAKERVNSFVSIPLGLLNKRKRRSSRVDVNECIENLTKLMQPVTDYYKTKIILNLSKNSLKINGSEALLEGILLNLVLNSFNAFQREGFVQQDRKIRICTVNTIDDVKITVEDNAGGIDGVSIEDIWLPGVTTVPDGTGFGLTIVRDSISDLGGRVHVEPLTDFGGAIFSIWLPPMRELFVA